MYVSTTNAKNGKEKLSGVNTKKHTKQVQKCICKIL